jgi:hypothetical protein
MPMFRQERRGLYRIIHDIRREMAEWREVLSYGNLIRPPLSRSRLDQELAIAAETLMNNAEEWVSTRNIFSLASYPLFDFYAIS